MKRAKPSESRSIARRKPSKNLPQHAFWSGAISFGLVNIPVLIYPATRHPGVRLRMIGPGGMPLVRRFFCPSEGAQVSSDQLVKGYELDDGSYIVVTDKELSDLEPKKSREIELRQFVKLGDISPLLMERGYYLTPDGQTTKAYRLLAHVMEKRQYAGIATFVMRDHEYLVAIFARNGILCAETLRFQDELRDRRQLGITEPRSVPRARIAAFERAIDALTKENIPKDDLADRNAAALRALVEKKKRASKSKIRVPKPRQAHIRDDGEGDVDLLETIRHSLRHASARR